MYAKQMKDDYTLADAFQHLGLRLYGPKWCGSEIWGIASEDVSTIIEARKPLEEKQEILAIAWNQALRDQKAAITQEDVQKANFDVSYRKKELDKVSAALNQIGYVENSKVRDHEQWKRYNAALDILRHALVNEHIFVVNPMSGAVPSRLWLDQPDGFGFDLENSLIFWPSSEHGRPMTSACIRKPGFEKWLSGIIPIVPHEGAELDVEQLATVWLTEQVKAWDGVTTRDQLKELAQAEFPELGERPWKRIWDACKTPQMKKPGAKKRS